MPFGLTSAPREFTKRLKPEVSILRKIGLRLIIYLDDIIILNQSSQALLRDRDSALWLLQTHSELGEVLIDSISNDRISGIHDQFRLDDVNLALKEGLRLTDPMPNDIDSRDGLRQSIIQIDRKTKRLSPSSTLLQPPSNDKGQGSSLRQLQHGSVSGCRMQRGNPLVASPLSFIH